MDTGRHAEHTQRILDYAKTAGLPIKPVVNSHWHLDHVGGNPRVRAAYPAVQVYASAAIEEAMQRLSRELSQTARRGHRAFEGRCADNRCATKSRRSMPAAHCIPT